MRSSLALALAAFGTIAAACGSEGAGGGTQPACTKDTDCAGGGKCENGQCTGVTCGASGQACCAGDACNAGLSCTSGTCTASSSCGASGQACCAGDACNAGLSCSGGTCSGGTSCGASGQACCAGNACNAGLACDGASQTCKTSSGGTGTPCTKNGDCPSGLCTPVGEANACTTTCTGDASCVPGWKCEMTSGTKICQCDPVHEVCDGKDDDCDGVVDNKPDGECIIMLANERANGIAVDATHVYYTTYDGVKKVPLTGGTPTMLAPTPNANYDKPSAIAVNATEVFWISSEAGGHVMKVSKNGGSPVMLADKQNRPQSLALDATNVYWVNSYLSSIHIGEVVKVPIAGGASTMLHSQTFTDPGDIVVDATDLYYTETSKGDIKKLSLSGGTPTTLLDLSNLGRRLVKDAQNLYFAYASVQKVPLSGGTPTMLASNPPVSLAVDAQHVYFTEYNGGKPTTGMVKKVPIAGGATVTLATGQGWPDSVAVDATHVYWTESAGAPGRVLRRVK